MSNAFHGSLFFKRRSVIKTLRIMNFMTILLLVCCLQISAHVSSQGVTLNVKKAPLDKVFREIREQTGYTFMYTESMIKEAKKVSIQVKDSPLQEVLDICFSTQPFTYNIIERTVVVQPRTVAAANISDHNMASVPPPVQIHGRVVNQNGEPLQNASVLIVGTQVGTATNNDGYFTLAAPDNNNISLEISSVGYQTKKVSVGTQSEINITLDQEVSGLSDVVVVGYGTTTKKDLTGSVSHLDAKVFQNQPMTQLTSMLAGTVGGLQVTQSSSAAGGGSMLIRGRKSLSGGTDPLIVLDGVIFDGSLININPNDIQSIDVMKDASSAAVYGASSAGGVILVTTKKGRIGKPTIDVSAKVGVVTTTHDLKPFGAEGYLNLHRDFLTQIAARGSSVPFGYYYSPNNLPDGISLEEWRSWSTTATGSNDIEEWLGRIKIFPTEIENYKAGKTTDFYDLVIGNRLQQDYSLGVSGGTEFVKYYLSGEYLDAKGLIKGDQFKTVRMRLNLDLKITDWLNVGTNTQFASRDQSVVPGNMNNMRVQSPYGSMWNDDGSVKTFPYDYNLSINPLQDYYNQRREQRTNTLFANLYANVKLPFGFNYKFSYQPNVAFGRDYNYWNPNTIAGGTDHVGGYGTREDATSYSWRADNILTWNKSFGIHKFDVTLLASAEVEKGWESYQENSSFAPSGTLGYNALQFGSSPALSDFDYHGSGKSLMGRLNYTLLDRYLLTASVRRDGYSAFGQRNPEATFPALALGWIISNESFFDISAIDFLKLRLSGGLNGNRNIGMYSALAQVGSVLDFDGSRVLTGVFNSSLENADLKWEKTQAFNIGLDVVLLDNRLSFGIDAYKSKTTDMLMNRVLPILTGFESITANLGQLDNTGINIDINSSNINKRNFKWNSNFVFSMNRNKIVKLFGDIGTYKMVGKEYSGELPDFSNGWYPGQASDMVWDYNIIGVWQSGEASAAGVYNLAPGDYKVEDVNGDKELLQFDDKKFIGNTVPQFNIGLRNEFTFFRNFSAGIFLRADLGYIRSIGLLTNSNQFSVLERQNIYAWPYWSLENPSNEFGRYVFPTNFGQYEGGLGYWRKAGFLRVQEFSLAYQIPQALIQRARLKGMRISIAASNLLTFTKWPGFDPESGMNPMPRIYNVGLNLSL